LFNYAIVIMSGITAVGLEEWWRKSQGVWFHNLIDINDASQETVEEAHDSEKGRRSLPESESGK
jgi:hypothetical protein